MKGEKTRQKEKIELTECQFVLLLRSKTGVEWKKETDMVVGEVARGPKTAARIARFMISSRRGHSREK